MVTFNLEDFAFADMVALGTALRDVCSGAESLQEVGQRIVRHLYDSLQSKETGRSACALVRLFATQRFEQLDRDLQRFATGMLGDAPATPRMRCLVLMATAGHWPEWNSPECSKGHRAIPLPSEEVLARLPMISQLLSQMGISSRALLEVDPRLVLDVDENSLSVFHVPEAVGSPYVPAQSDFVVAHGIRSVVGFGGLLGRNDVFAVIIFSRTFISRQAAELFKTVGLMIRLAINPLATDRVFGNAVGALRSR